MSQTRPMLAFLLFLSLTGCSLKNGGVFSAFTSSSNTNSTPEVVVPTAVTQSPIQSTVSQEGGASDEMSPVYVTLGGGAGDAHGFDGQRPGGGINITFGVYVYSESNPDLKTALRENQEISYTAANSQLLNRILIVGLHQTITYVTGKLGCYPVQFLGYELGKSVYEIQGLESVNAEVLSLSVEDVMRDNHTFTINYQPENLNGTLPEGDFLNCQ